MIKKARKSAGLSQEKLGEMCGWTNAQNRISNYETGKREPRRRDLEKIIAALGEHWPRQQSALPAPPVNGYKWPFKEVSYEQIRALNREDVRRVEDAIKLMLDAIGGHHPDGKSKIKKIP